MISLSSSSDATSFRSSRGTLVVILVVFQQVIVQIDVIAVIIQQRHRHHRPGASSSLLAFLACDLSALSAVSVRDVLPVSISTTSPV